MGSEALTQTSKKEDLRLDVVQYKGKKFEPKMKKKHKVRSIS
ncbi:MAG: hypothetical protein ACLR5N_02230 [Haemophilus parainfluenzae]